jgi:hypothetical protein
MGVLILELGEQFNASPLELNAAATLSYGVLMFSCKGIYKMRNSFYHGIIISLSKA